MQKKNKFLSENIFSIQELANGSADVFESCSAIGWKLVTASDLCSKTGPGSYRSLALSQQFHLSIYLPMIYSLHHTGLPTLQYTPDWSAGFFN